MTADEFPHTFRGKIIEWGKIAGAVSAMCAAIVLVFGYAFYIRDWIELQKQESLRLDKLVDSYNRLSDEMNALHQQVQEQSDSMDRLSSDVDLATRPRVIFEINEGQSGARDGFCVELQNCTIDIRVRRTVEGINCSVVEGSARFYFIENDSGARIQVTMLSGTPLTNVARDWFDYHWTFEVPADLVEPVGFLYEFTYDQCRGPHDSARLRQESPVVPIRIVKRSQRTQTPAGSATYGIPNDAR